MAKDPAILWYWSDWGGGTKTFTRHMKGCYMDLLEAQFNSGPLSMDEIRTVLGTDFGQAWPTLQKKFTATDAGLFYNERMETEKAKRRKFTESRRNNLISKKDPHMDYHMGGHMGPHMENRNVNRNTILNPDGGTGEGLIYDIERYLLDRAIDLEATLVTVRGMTREVGLEVLTKYHLHLQSIEAYPKAPLPLIAGYKKWLINEKKFSNGTGQRAASAERSAYRGTTNGIDPTAINNEGFGKL